jgi:hypothetical protein
MQEQILLYADVRKEKTKQAISQLLTDYNTKQVAEKAFKYHFTDEKSLAFQKYYIATVANQGAFLYSSDFFRIFKQQYALQGVDSDFLGRLEREKRAILDLIIKDDLASLYFGFFFQVRLKHGDEIVHKDLGSFFAKLVHTFSPEKYCALDNPIKDYLGLGKESFFVSFVIISQSYREWAQENPDLMGQISNELKGTLPAEFYSSKMTNLKLLDLIFWYQANIIGNAL